MPLPIIAPSWAHTRQEIARKLRDLITGTAAGGSTTTLTDTGDLDRWPTTPQYLLGSEVSVIAGTGAVESRHVTTHAKAGGTVTLTVPTWTAPDTTSDYEIHKIGGRGFDKADYDEAMNQAIYSLSDTYWTDVYSVPFGIERSGNGSQNQSVVRYEYPMPSGFLYLYGVDFLNSPAASRNPLGYATTVRALGDATARTRVWQGFKVQQSGWYEWVSVAIQKVGTPTDNLTCLIMTDSSGIPSGTTVTNGTSDNLDGSTPQERLGYSVFRFDPPVYLTQDTQYHMVFARSAAVSGSNYWRLAEDTNDTYGEGTMGVYDAVTYTAVSGSDLCFAIFGASTNWKAFRSPYWQYKRVGSDQIYIPVLPDDGTPIRLRGGAPLSTVTTSAMTAALEAAAITIPPEYMIAYAVKALLGSKVGQSLPDNYAQALQAANAVILDKPKPHRALPTNTVEVYA